MTNSTNAKKYNLDDRTAKFGEDTIKFCRKIPRGPITDPLINQLINAVRVLEQITVRQTMQKASLIFGIK